MTVQVYWQIDPAEDARRSEPAARGVPTLFRDVRTAAINRYDYYAQIAQAAAQTAFEGVFLAYRPDSDDSRTIAAAIARETPGVALVAEFPASVGSPVYAAKQAVSGQRVGGRRGLGRAGGTLRGAAGRGPGERGIVRAGAGRCERLRSHAAHAVR